MRREFPNSVKRAALKRCIDNGALCECHLLVNVPGIVPGGCGRRIGPGNTFYEHVNPDGNGGGSTLENCCVLTKTCWSIKTRRYDQPLVARTKRLFDRHHHINRKPSQPMPCGKNSGWKMPMRGWHAERRL